jgi:2-hydroxy-3-oxopropionate reductase
MLDAPFRAESPRPSTARSPSWWEAKWIIRQVFRHAQDEGGSVVLYGDIGAGNITNSQNQIIVALNIAAM